MLRHALELFEHGIFHYLDKTDVGRKFALLHIDHSIELVLKEKIVRVGTSIYKSNGKTIGIHEAYAALSHISIPEKPRLEDLHDFRNIVQHKGLTPDQHTTEFFINEAYAFVKRFLKDELNLQLESYLPRHYVQAMEGLDKDLPKEVRRRLKEAEKLFSSGAHEVAVISAFAALEIAVREKLKNIAEPSTSLPSLIRLYIDSGMSDKPSFSKMRHVYALRNRAAHTGTGITRDEAREALDIIQDIIKEFV